MYFLIKTERATDCKPSENVVATHRAYLTINSTRILAIGPTFFEGISTPEGAMYLFEAEDWEEVRRFVSEDPLTIAKGRSKIEIWAWSKKGFDGIYPLVE